MDVLITSSRISGTITAPPSKSYTHRAIILATLARGISHITHWLDSDDTKATIEACRVLGATITVEADQLSINGIDGKPNATMNTIDCNASGTTMRLITAIAALSEKPITIKGTHRLNQRPMEPLLDALISLGCKVEYHENEGFSPFTIHKGLPLQPQQGQPLQELGGDISSQFISALYLISPFFNPPLLIGSKGTMRSQSYIDMTRESMNIFGKGPYSARDYKVEGDFSQASYFFAAAAITGGTINVKGLNKDSKQGDKYLLELLRRGGCSISWDGTSCTVSGTCKTLPESIDMGNYPDIVQTVTALAATLPQKTTISNINHLAQKETDRLANTVRALHSLGIKAECDTDSITIFGGQVTSGTVETYNDHRMAMSMAVAALVGTATTTIKNAEVVQKSYPNFWKNMRSVKATIEES